MNRESLIMLVGVLLVMGEIGPNEITAQEVSWGQPIEQYCIIMKQTAFGVGYKWPCQDCSAYISVYGSGRPYVLDAPMLNMSEGLFGYIALSGVLPIRDGYDVVSNCTSPIFGSGSVRSRLNVVPDHMLAPVSGSVFENLSGFKPINEGCNFGDLGCYLKNYWDNLVQLPLFVLREIYDIVFMTTNIHQYIIKPLADSFLGKGLFTTVKMMIDYMVWVIHYWSDFIGDPGGTFNSRIIPDIRRTLVAFISLFAIPLMIVEMLAITYTFTQTRGGGLFEWTHLMISLHFSMLKGAGHLTGGLFNFTGTLYREGRDTLNFIRHLLPGG